MRKYMVWLLIALFCLIGLFSHAGIIYTERDSTDGTDIIHLKSGRQIEGRVIERGPDRVKIEVASDSNPGNKKNTYTYRSNDVERVEVSDLKERTSKFWRNITYGLSGGLGCLVSYVFLGLVLGAVLRAW